MVDACWQVLGIEPTADLKAIKRAYATKLKVTKPEDDPAAFQLLHSSYKSAQQLAKRMPKTMSVQPEVNNLTVQAYDNDAVLPTASESNQLQHDWSEQQQAPYQVVQTNVDDYYYNQQAEDEDVANGEIYINENEQLEAFHSLIERFQLTLQDDTLRNKVESYDFLMHCPYILVPDFRQTVCIALFEAITQYEQQLSNRERRGSRKRRSSNAYGANKITPKVLHHLDSIVNFSARVGYLSDMVSYKQAQGIFRRIEYAQKETDDLEGLRGSSNIERHKMPTEMDTCGLGRRFIALMIDVAVLFCLFYGLGEILDALQFDPEQLKTENGLDFYVILLVVAIPMYFFVMEARFAATVGKLLLGIRVVDFNFAPPSPSRILWRTIVFCLSSIGMKITWIINMIMAPVLIHDRMSNTLVINKKPAK